jgi:hypothetical protein
MDKSTIINLIRKHIAQRSGINWRDYTNGGHDVTGREALRSDYTRILRHGRDARVMLRAVDMSSVTAETLIEHLTCGRRLSLVNGALEYTTGQYFPTEYRRAACDMLASVLIDHYGHNNATDERKPLARARDWAKSNLGRGIAGRWFV